MSGPSCQSTLSHSLAIPYSPCPMFRSVLSIHFFPFPSHPLPLSLPILDNPHHPPLWVKATLYETKMYIIVWFSDYHIFLHIEHNSANPIKFNAFMIFDRKAHIYENVFIVAKSYFIFARSIKQMHI